MSWKVPYINLPVEYNRMETHIDEVIKGVLKSGRFVLGDRVRAFEEDVVEYLGVKHAIGVNSGTDALFLSLKALGVGPGDEVITVAHTHISTIASVIHCGAKPILVDVDSRDFNMDVDRIEEKVTDRTQAIIPVHLNGRCCRMDYILDIANKYNLLIVEDACQALGAKYKGDLAGAFAVGCFSFHPLKTLSAIGDGGLITTNDSELDRKIRLLRNHGTLDKVNYERFGYNSRLDEIQAAVLSCKMMYLGEWIERRRGIAGWYDKQLKKIHQIKLPYGPDMPHFFDTYNSYVILAEGRDSLKEFLESKGVETFVSWNPPLHKQMNLNFDLPVTEQLSQTVLSLPIHPYLTNDQIDYVIDSIKEYYAR